jgi:hypothetical protein
MKRVISHGRALGLALLVCAASACDSNGPERLLEGWERDGREVPQAEFQVYAGPLHCDMDDALILNMRWPVGSNGEGTGASFVRDPDGVMAHYTDAPFVPDTELPDDAVPTGYENDAEVELWLASDLSAAYLVDGGTVEAWPALQSWVCA